MVSEQLLKLIKNPKPSLKLRFRGLARQKIRIWKSELTIQGVLT